ncbi:MAG: bifunctional 23S rRNA (guanine(2069)-N(7))-methyltransferase RlmK/23S rRNA (guanine(2445)-N(2))-methyltransferase RlmL [Thiotrichaceae bacterium]|nr:bifunctional 23S rRNA (guanine(2069)-N(7))-methyltransferase RlmK/23S rRNA (guanine(2445)-N(2))-methyltransferase RlmL [Thiotrichaceae bacterium]
MSATFKLFITAPKGLEPLLADELIELGLNEVRPTRAGVSCQGTLAQAYRICLWSRIANRVLLPLTSFPAPTDRDLYAGIAKIEWEEHLSKQGCFAVEFTSLHSAMKHTHYGALKVKDAIVDQFRERYQIRPDVVLEQPDIRINVHLREDVASVSLDLSGESLHKRGYRTEGVLAPLKENLAAAILRKAGWDKIAAAGGSLLDPMCGSGTFLVEAALIAADIAPGLERDYFGFTHWKQHQPEVWAELIKEARERRAAGLAKLPLIQGYDSDISAVRIATGNIQRAGFANKIHVEHRALAQFAPNPEHKTGLVIVNPPYGERLGVTEELRHLYGCLGDRLKNHFADWEAAVLVSHADLGKCIGIRAHRMFSFYNGALECKLLRFHLQPEWFMHAYHAQSPKKQAEAAATLAKTQVAEPQFSDSGQMFANRLKKNVKNLAQWVQRENIHCYRLYDADLPEYALAVDVYEEWLHVQEYAPPKTIDPDKAAQRLAEALNIISEVLDVPSSRIYLKVRRPQKGTAQYVKHNQSGQFFEVHEGDAVFLVNLSDYLDTGLFLDHRLTRQMLHDVVEGKRFLNLFAYTGTATVQAALGGASSTTSVDMSKSYLAWARRNLARNGFSDQRHHFIQEDCIAWLAKETQHYEVIFLDPPTFSNSKRMEGVLDVQRDHVELIRAAMRCLTRRGVLIFSNNYQRFKLDTEALSDLEIQDMSAATLPKDFARNPKIHQCWKIANKI